MDTHESHLPQNLQDFTDRFVRVCRGDGRIAAAFLGGSNSKGGSDEFSDLDLYLILQDGAYEDFCASSEAFVLQLGEPLFQENFGNENITLLIFADGTECDLFWSRESDIHNHNIHAGPYQVLLDKKGILAGAVFPMPEAEQAAQVELLGKQIAWFWHELSHFIKAIGRGQYWFAYGEIEAMRRICVNLARLRNNFPDPWVGDEPFFKVEDSMPVEQLSPLLATCCPMEREAMLQAAGALFRFYRETATALAREHSLVYPAALERLLIHRLEKLNP